MKTITTNVVAGDYVRQGDVYLRRIDEPQAASRAMGADGEPLAGLSVPGERSGHEHRLPAEIYDVAGGRVAFLREATPMRVVHSDDPTVEFLMPDGTPRHEAIEVPAGWWQVVPQRQYVPQRRPVSRARYD